MLTAIRLDHAGVGGAPSHLSGGMGILVLFHTEFPFAGYEPEALPKLVTRIWCPTSQPFTIRTTMARISRAVPENT